MSVDPPPESTSGTAEYSTGSFSGLVMTQSNASTEQPPAEEANDRHSHGTNVGVSVSYDIDDLGGLRTDTANLEATAQSATAVSFATNPTENLQMVTAPLSPRTQFAMEAGVSLDAVAKFSEHCSPTVIPLMTIADWNDLGIVLRDRLRLIDHANKVRAESGLPPLAPPSMQAAHGVNAERSFPILEPPPVQAANGAPNADESGASLALAAQAPPANTADPASLTGQALREQICADALRSTPVESLRKMARARKLYNTVIVEGNEEIDSFASDSVETIIHNTTRYFLYKAKDDLAASTRDSALTAIIMLIDFDPSKTMNEAQRKQVKHAKKQLKRTAGFQSR